ncbi:MAG: hypothetical protein WBA88_02595 [Pseudaminobacter sp.]
MTTAQPVNVMLHNRLAVLPFGTVAPTGSRPNFARLHSKSVDGIIVRTTSLETGCSALSAEIPYDSDYAETALFPLW